MTLRILLADDHLMFRETLSLILAQKSDLLLLGQAGTGEELLRLLACQPVDLVVLDIGLPDMSGMEVAKLIRRQYPQVGIVALSGYTDRLFVEEMLKAGARGYVAKSAGVEDLLRAIRAVTNGQAFLSPEVAGALLPAVDSADGPPPASILGARERQILTLLASGQRSADIATALGIAVATVNVHRRNIKAKLGLRTVAELTRYAIRQGLTHSQ